MGLAGAYPSGIRSCRYSRTGNIVGVAGAIIVGGPGAVFWMWIIAFFGMMTNYSENVLGIYYRRKNIHGEWPGGAMYYLRDGLGSSVMVHSSSNVIEPVRQGIWGIFEVFAEKYTIVYRVIFVAAIYGGAVMGDNLAWGLADTFNGMMMIPNLIGVLILSPQVYRITANYVNRIIKGKSERPILSAIPEIQAEQKKT